MVVVEFDCIAKQKNRQTNKKTTTVYVKPGHQYTGKLNLMSVSASNDDTGCFTRRESTFIPLQLNDIKNLIKRGDVQKVH